MERQKSEETLQRQISGQTSTLLKQKYIGLENVKWNTS